jgi:hypothetical protein
LFLHKSRLLGGFLLSVVCKTSANFFYTVRFSTMQAEQKSLRMMLWLVAIGFFMLTVHVVKKA